VSEKKIVLIGAGSVSFTAGLVADVLCGPSIGRGCWPEQWTIGLVDIDERALGVARGLTRRMVEARGAACAIEASTDRCEVLPGADVVVTTIGVGGRRAWAADARIPREYGVYQPVGDTVMAGGISRAMRQIPPMVAIANDVARLCPNAHFFNYGNPMAAICRAVNRATPARVTGLCHGVQGTVRYLCSLAGVPYSETSALYFGMNHLTWVTHVTHGGESLWPRIEARCAELGDELGEPFSWELYRAYGAFPAVLDRHVVEFFPEFFPQGAYYGKQLGVGAYSIESIIEGGDKHFEHLADQAEGRVPLDAGIFERTAGEHEALIDIVGSTFADAHAVFPMNVPNMTVPQIPTGFVMELPVLATSAGRIATTPPLASPGLLATISEALWGVEITVDAALQGSRDLWVQALLYDRCVISESTARRLVDDLIAAHREYLPQFA